MSGTGAGWLALAALVALGAAALGLRLSRSLRVGFSIRMQVFLALAGASFGLAVASIAWLHPETLATADARAGLRLGFSAFLIAGAAAVAAIAIGHVVAQPLERLTRAAQRIAAGERQAALPVPRGREVRELTSAFEAMRAQLEERHAIERFVADLSHELKNPIASIRASSEVLFDALERDPEHARRFLQRIDEAAHKLDHLTADLLTLARLEARGGARETTRLDLRGVAQQAVQTLHAITGERALTITTHAPEPALVRGEAPVLQRALENLLRNACHHAPHGSTVELRVAREGAEHALLVIDQGPGVDPAVSSRLFERFTTTRQQQGGTGLGLAIARAVAEAHGGRAELRSPAGGSPTIFALVLPAA